MYKFISISLSAFLTVSLLAGCGKKKESTMVDMDTIQTDGSHDDKYIFRDQIEKEEQRKNRYKKNQF